MSDFDDFVPDLREFQESLMTNTLDTYRAGSIHLTDVPCRVTSNRLFAEPADPYDANVRSMAEWGFTVPHGTDVVVGDRIVCVSQGLTLDLNAGEVVAGDTWETAVRIWCNKPKTATPHVSIVLWRYNTGTDDFVALSAQDVQVVYDRNAPVETPLRYSPATRSSYKGGWLVGDPTFDVAAEDRFVLDGYHGIISQVLPEQPQRIEAAFILDVGGPR